MPDEHVPATDPGTQTTEGGYQLSASEAELLRDAFAYQAPTPDQIPRYQAIRAAARHLAETIIINASPCADRSAAIRDVRNAVMHANAAIALRGRF